MEKLEHAAPEHSTFYEELYSLTVNKETQKTDEETA